MRTRRAHPVKANEDLLAVLLRRSLQRVPLVVPIIERPRTQQIEAAGCSLVQEKGQGGAQALIRGVGLRVGGTAPRTVGQHRGSAPEKHKASEL